MERSGFKMIFKKLKLFVPVMLGALLGFLYYSFIGCDGNCSITSSPVKSSLYGAFVGLILTDWKQIKLLFNKMGDQK